MTVKQFVAEMEMESKCAWGIAAMNRGEQDTIETVSESLQLGWKVNITSTAQIKIVPLINHIAWLNAHNYKDTGH